MTALKSLCTPSSRILGLLIALTVIVLIGLQIGAAQAIATADTAGESDHPQTMTPCGDDVYDIYFCEFMTVSGPPAGDYSWDLPADWHRDVPPYQDPDYRPDPGEGDPEPPQAETPSIAADNPDDIPWEKMRQKCIAEAKELQVLCENFTKVNCFAIGLSSENPWLALGCELSTKELCRLSYNDDLKSCDILTSKPKAP